MKIDRQKLALALPSIREVLNGYRQSIFNEWISCDGGELELKALGKARRELTACDKVERLLTNCAENG